jgi:hypothetical protein
MLARIIAEERALDSFYNIVFSLTLFYARTQCWPTHVTIVANEFKRARFEQLHIPALRWPLDRLEYVGIDPEFMTDDEQRALFVRTGERLNGFEAWTKDPRGMSDFLVGKRKRRNNWEVEQGLFEGDEDGVIKNESGISWEVADGREILGKGRQPWEE